MAFNWNFICQNSEYLKWISERNRWNSLCNTSLALLFFPILVFLSPQRVQMNTAKVPYLKFVVLEPTLPSRLPIKEIWFDCVLRKFIPNVNRSSIQQNQEQYRLNTQRSRMDFKNITLYGIFLIQLLCFNYNFFLAKLNTYTISSSYTTLPLIF